jgi:hypothetical protein
MKCPTRTLIRHLSTFFAIMFAIYFLGCVITAASGSPMRVLHSMLIAECAAGFFAFVAVNTDPRKVD